MVLDIEPENPDVERAMSGGTGSMAMSGIGSGLDSTNKDPTVLCLNKFDSTVF